MFFSFHSLIQVEHRYFLYLCAGNFFFDQMYCHLGSLLMNKLTLSFFFFQLFNNFIKKAVNKQTNTNQMAAKTQLPLCAYAVTAGADRKFPNCKS